MNIPSRLSEIKIWPLLSRLINKLLSIQLLLQFYHIYTPRYQFCFPVSSSFVALQRLIIFSSAYEVYLPNCQNHRNVMSVSAQHGAYAVNQATISIFMSLKRWVTMRTLAWYAKSSSVCYRIRIRRQRAAVKDHQLYFARPSDAQIILLMSQ